MRTRKRGTRHLAAGWGMVVAMLAVAAPAAGWDQAYGNLSNTSFVNAITKVPVVANWAYQLDGEIGMGGPAVDPVSGTIYLGTANGTFWAFQPDGNVQCKRNFKGPAAIHSIPAVFPNGDIAILVTRALDETRKQTALVRMASNCDVVWQVDLPVLTWPSTATGSAKIWTLDGQSFIFVHAANSKPDVTFAPYTFHELVVYDDNGQLFARHPVGEGCVELHGGGRFRAGGRSPKGIGDSPAGGLAPQLSVFSDWPDSTPAILDKPLHGFATPRAPLVAVTEDHCKVRLEVLQFDPALPELNRLVKRWGDHSEEEGVRLSSPAVTPEGLIVFGTSCYKVRIYDLNTLSRKSFDATYRVVHPPALAPDVWIVNSEYAVHFLKPGTPGLAETARPQPHYTLGSATGLAASATEVVVPNLQELGIWTHDLRVLTHALTAQEFRTSSPALTPEGRLYVVSQTNPLSILYAFGPP